MEMGGAGDGGVSWGFGVGGERIDRRGDRMRTYEDVWLKTEYIEVT